MHPWYYYLGDDGRGLHAQRAAVADAARAASSLRRADRAAPLVRRHLVVLLWATVPLALISVGTSKLYHYAYPVSAAADARGRLPGRAVVMLAPVVVAKLLERAEDRRSRAIAAARERARVAAGGPDAAAPRHLAGGGRGRRGRCSSAISARRRSAGVQLFKSSGVVRPLGRASSWPAS